MLDLFKVLPYKQGKKVFPDWYDYHKELEKKYLPKEKSTMKTPLEEPRDYPCPSR